MHFFSQMFHICAHFFRPRWCIPPPAACQRLGGCCLNGAPPEAPRGLPVGRRGIGGRVWPSGSMELTSAPTAATPPNDLAPAHAPACGTEGSAPPPPPLLATRQPGRSSSHFSSSGRRHRKRCGNPSSCEIQQAAPHHSPGAQQDEEGVFMV